MTDRAQKAVNPEVTDNDTAFVEAGPPMPESPADLRDFVNPPDTGFALDPVTRTISIGVQTVEELRVALMRAQTDFIRAQETYIHEKDLTAFLTAQQDFINAMGLYLKTVGDMVLADVQEQFIGVQIKALTAVGVL